MRFLLPAVALIFSCFLVSKSLGLKCYFCDDSKSCQQSAKVISCRPARANFPPPDQCFMHRETAIINGTKVITKDKRDCIYSYKCIKILHCKNEESKNKTCEAGCCTGELCNHHGFTPSDPKYNTPKGKDLSCTSCSDLPDGVLTRNLPVASAKCDKPSTQTCGNSSLNSALIQDRCITMKVTQKKQNGDSKEMFYRTCSDMSFCSVTQANWKFILKDKMVTPPEVEFSCCSGNFCNSAGSKPVLQTSLSCFTSLALWFLLYLWA